MKKPLRKIIKSNYKTLLNPTILYGYRNKMKTNFKYYELNSSINDLNLIQIFNSLKNTNILFLCEIMSEIEIEQKQKILLKVLPELNELNFKVKSLDAHYIIIFSPHFAVQVSYTYGDIIKNRPCSYFTIEGFIAVDNVKFEDVEVYLTQLKEVSTILTK